MSEQALVQEWMKKDPYLLDAEGLQKFLADRMPEVIKQEERANEILVSFLSIDCSVCKLHLRCKFELRIFKKVGDRCNFFGYSIATLNSIATTELTKRYGSCCSGNYGHYLACRFKDCPPNFLDTCQRVEESLDSECKGCPGINCENCTRRNQTI